MIKLSPKYSYITLATGIFIVIAGFIGGNETPGFIGLGIAIFALFLAALTSRSRPKEQISRNIQPHQNTPESFSDGPHQPPTYNRNAQTIADSLVPMLDECLSKASVTIKLTGKVPVTQDFDYKGHKGQIAGEATITIDNTVSKDLRLPKPEENNKPEAEPVILERSVRD